ncbi:MAG: hypothetical protein IID03_09005 [Candidatus Dadabacteria bacterium]|nr:hypothetical protein [Candidatus Dadabacteria bacterium]
MKDSAIRDVTAGMSHAATNAMFTNIAAVAAFASPRISTVNLNGTIIVVACNINIRTR